MTKESRVLENKPLVESKIQESTADALTEEDYWENFSLTVTQDIQTKTKVVSTIVSKGIRWIENKNHKKIYIYITNKFLLASPHF